MTMPDDAVGRRVYDDIIPVVMLQVEERLRDTRHTLRQEVTVLATTVATGQMQASKEHEAVRTDIADLKRAVEKLVPVAQTVDELREQAVADKAHDDAIGSLLKTARWGFGALMLLITVATAVLGLVVH